ncbi:hypothetical protein BAE44_0010523, partial [Dichanthelium oligosanthes]
LPRPSHIPHTHFETLVLLYCWHLWKRRNGIIFWGEVTTLRQTLLACKLDANLWRCRMRKD